MKDPEFWRTFAKKFSRLDLAHSLTAEWSYCGEDPKAALFSLPGEYDFQSLQAEFKTLATRAGLRLNPSSGFPVLLWLREVRQHDCWTYSTAQRRPQGFRR
jgi:hypothetical protein